MAVNDKEIWKPVTHLKVTPNKKYAISNKARVASYETKIDDLFILKQHLNGGFPMVTIHVKDRTKALFTHHAVAHSFLKKLSPKYKHVLHLDYNKANNDPSNLKWATKEEQVEHSKKSPFVLAAAARKVYTGATSKKLNEKKVIQLKTEIWNPKRKLTFKQLAAKYDIAEMNLYRIKNGELWFHVHVEGEPVFAKYTAQLKNIEFHAKFEAKAKAAYDKRKEAKVAKKKEKFDKKKLIAKIAAEKKLAGKERAAKERAAKKLEAKKLAVKKRALKELTAKKLAAKKLSAKKLASKKAVTKKVVKKRAATKKPALKTKSTVATKTTSLKANKKQLVEKPKIKKDKKDKKKKNKKSKK
ncbi:MAG: HNH endonuclease [Burkholderiales bacterium]|nr:HNH endonuclease [Bacteroidia bacterium]